MTSPWGDGATKHFYELDYNEILNSIEALGLKTTGQISSYGAMENRVYEVELELDFEPKNPSEKFIVAKFYRPGRWSESSILDEHEFLLELMEEEIPVIAPLKITNKTLFQTKTGIYFTLFPKMGGRAIDEWTEELSLRMGRILARLHVVGKRKKAHHRIILNPENYIEKNFTSLVFPKHLESASLKLKDDLLKKINPLFNGIEMFRIHGDSHHGNTILRGDSIYLIDFDDMVMGPSIQDIWMIHPARDSEATFLRNKLLEGYEEFLEFNDRELKLIEPLRAMRMVHHAAWISKRYEDQTFKNAFPHFREESFFINLYQDLNDILNFI